MSDNKEELSLKKIFQKYNEEHPHEKKFHADIADHLKKFHEHETKKNVQNLEDEKILVQKAVHPFSFILETLKSIVIILGLFLAFRGFVALPFQVDGQSMEPTLHTKEFIYVDKLFPRIFGYERGEVIVFYPPYKKTTQVSSLMCLLYKAENIIFFQNNPNPCEVQASYVKRIIGISGDIIEIENGKVFVTPKDGKRTEIAENFLLENNKNATCVLEGTGVCSQEKRIFGPVPEGSYFVLGDNRTASSDSRAFRWITPFVSEDKIFGVARFVYFSPPQNFSGILGLPGAILDGITHARPISKESLMEKPAH